MALFSRSLKPGSGDEGAPIVTGDAEGDASARYTIGELLRQTRKSYGGEIDRVAATLRIRASYLTAIEEGHYDRLPGPVYAQGFVRAYAVHLGLDGDEAIRRFKQEVAGFEVSRDLSFPVPLAERSIPGGTMLLAALILAICGYGLWYYVSTGDRAHPERVAAVPPDLVAASQPPPPPAPTPAAPASAAATLDAQASSPAPPIAAPPDTPAASPAAPGMVTASPPPVVPPAPVAAAAPAAPPAAPPPAPAVAVAPAAAPAPPPTAPASDQAPPAPRVFGAPADVPTRIVIHAIKDSWVQLRNGDEVLIERILHPGDSLRVPDDPGLSLRTGNGAGIEIEVDGKLGKPLSGTVRTVALDANRLAGGPPRGD